MLFWSGGAGAFSLPGLVFPEEELAVVVALAVFLARVEPAAFVACVLFHLEAGGWLARVAVACRLLELKSKRVVVKGLTHRARRRP